MNTTMRVETANMHVKYFSYTQGASVSILVVC